MTNQIKLIQGDCIDMLKTIDSNSIDAIVTDPPYELGFMGKSWDNAGIANNVEMWKECLRVLKPGGHLLSFGGTRTYHRMASAIEDAGFEVRDMIEWVYGSGFPKSLNIGKAVDKLQGNERIVTGEIEKAGFIRAGRTDEEIWLGGNPVISSRAKTKGASEWEGWGTALKPAHESICMARKPLSEKNVALNVLKWGTGGINIDESRVEAQGQDLDKLNSEWDREWNTNYTDYAEKVGGNAGFNMDKAKKENACLTGRFPANLIHDGSEEVRECFPNESERFFKSIIYQAKASKSERNKGLDSIVLVDIIKLCNENNTTKEEKLIRLMVTGISPQKVIAESGVQLKNANEWNTCLFGKHLMEKYQEDIKSITKTETNSITTSQTLNWLTHLLTNEYTVGVNLEMGNGGNLVENAVNSNTLIITINEAIALALGVKDVVSGMQLKINVKEGSNIHSTVKPIALMEYLINMVTREGQTVLDMFMGSGTTGVACKNLNRNFIGIEKEEEYFKIANARIYQEETNK